MKASIQLSAFLALIFLQATTAKAENPAAASADFEISAGAEQDSNLNIVELDRSSNESDIAALLNAKVDANWKPVEKLSLSGGYAYSSKTYQNNDNYNLAIHQLSADAHYDFDEITMGGSYHNAKAILDGKSFLDLKQTSVYASKLINNKIYLRIAANNQDKNFSSLSERNATNKGFAGDLFIFSNGGKTFVNLGVANEKEDANAKQFDYSGINLKAKVANKFSLWNKENKLQLGYRYLKRDYSGITPEIKAKRYDTGNIAEASWEVAFTPKISVETKLEHGKYKSNLDAADYSETRVAVLLKAKF
ncbi:MAG: DUF560 domain-containing protein [Gammaproteobacteria bacterium]|nr:MAG: DUF560 domain-containing protein [Gammaproteobacteria bacterium]